MSVIRINIEDFDKTADNIDIFVDQLKLKMHNADTNISSMLTGWQGEDAMFFKMKWDALSEDGSLFYNMSESLRRYAQYLRDTKRVYQEAQERCIAESKSLKVIV